MRKLTIFLILMISLFTLSLFNSHTASASILPDANGNWYFNYQSQLDENYYKNADTSNAQTLKDSLHRIISTNAVRHSYDSLRDNLMITDAYPGKPGYALCVLTGKAFKRSDFGSTGETLWNREHIWPKSHGFPEDNGNNYAYTDMHHLHPGEAYTNSTYHNNYDYGEVTNGTSDEWGNKYTPGVYEPRDCVKGDIARSIFYMEIRYTGDSLSKSIELHVVNKATDGGKTNGYGEYGFRDTLIKWMEQDPVDDFERKRNDEVFKLQKNRNPLIDHPEYANILYGTKIEAEGKRVHYDTTNCTFDYVDNNVYKPGDKVQKPTSTPVYNEPGYQFVAWCRDPYLSQTFDFDNDTIGDKNITLYPYFMYVGLTKEEEFKNIDTLASLGIKYKVHENGNKTVKKAKETVTYTNFTGNGSYKTAYDQTYNLDGSDAKLNDVNLGYNTNIFEMYVHSNKSTSIYVGGANKEIRLYKGSNGNGTSIEIKTKPGFKITSVKTNVSNSNLAITILDNGHKAIIQNTGGSTIKNITSITIAYESESSTSYEILDDFRLTYRAYLPAELIDKFSENTKFGIEIDDVKYYLDYDLIGDDFAITYQIKVKQNLKDNVFKVRVFVEDEGVTTYAKSCDYSVKSIALTYLEKYTFLPEVEALKDLLIKISA